MRKLEQFNSETKEPEKEIGLTLDEKGKLQEEGEKIYAEKFVEKLQDVLDHEFESKDGKEKIILRDIVDKYLPKFTEPGFFDLPQEKQSELQKEFVQELISQISKIPEGKWSMDFEKAVETGKMNCSNCATLTGLILEEAGFKNVEYGTPAGHATNIVSFSDGRTYFADSRNGIFEDLDVDKDTTSEDREGVKVYKTKKPEVFWEIIPVMPQKEGAVASYLENLNAAYNHKADDFYPDFKEVYSPEETEEIKREYLRLGRIKNLFGGKISRYYGTPEFREEEKRVKEELDSRDSFEKEKLVSELGIVDQQIIKDAAKRYEIFFGYCYGKMMDNKENLDRLKRKWKIGDIQMPTQEQLSERASKAFGEDPIYKIILEEAKKAETDQGLEKLGSKIETREILIPILAKRLSKDMLKYLREEKEKGEDEFKKAIECVLAKIASSPEIGAIGNLTPEFKEGGKKCNLHFSRVGGDAFDVKRKTIESFIELAESLKTDKRFERVEEIEGYSWLLGQEKFIRDFDNMIKWDKITLSEEYTKDPRAAIFSPSFFEKYLLTGELPTVEGRTIAKDKFIKNIGLYKKQIRQK